MQVTDVGSWEEPMPDDDALCGEQVSVEDEADWAARKTKAAGVSGQRRRNPRPIVATCGYVVRCIQCIVYTVYTYTLFTPYHVVYYTRS